MHTLINFHGVRFYVEQSDLITDIILLVIACSAMVTVIRLHRIYGKPLLLRNILVGILILIMALILKIDDDIFALPWIIRYTLMDIAIIVGGIYIGISFSALARELYKDNSIDNLTGCFNKCYFESAICEHSKQPQKYSILYVDADNFKMVNDSIGHYAGDILLKELTKTIRGMVRTCDIVARLGGDEFVVLLLNSDEDEARDAANRITKAIATKFKDFYGIPITVSIGTATFPTDAENPTDLIKIADQRMYEVKAGKKRKNDNLIKA